MLHVENELNKMKSQIIKNEINGSNKYRFLYLLAAISISLLCIGLALFQSSIGSTSWLRPIEITIIMAALWCIATVTSIYHIMIFNVILDNMKKNIAIPIEMKKIIRYTILVCAVIVFPSTGILVLKFIIPNNQPVIYGISFIYLSCIMYFGIKSFFAIKAYYRGNVKFKGKLAAFINRIEEKERKQHEDL